MQPVISNAPHYTIPNMLTMFRVVLIPVFVVIYYLPFEDRFLWAAIIFALASITDWFDGYLARKWGQVTKLGAFLDPVADKLMVAAALIVLVEAHASLAMALPAIVIVSREIAISALREWMAEVGKRSNVAVSMMGKVKTTAQMIAITGLLANAPHVLDGVVYTAFSLLYFAAIITLWSMFVYLRAAWPDLTER